MLNRRAFNGLMSCASLSNPPEETVEIIGKDPVIDTPFLAGEAAASALVVQAAAVSEIWEMRTGRRQHVSVNVKAAVNSLTGINNIYQSGHLVDIGFANDPTVGFYPTLDSKWIFILGFFPQLRDNLLTVLNCANNRSAIGEAIAKWNAHELEDALAQHDLAGAMLRTQDEWRYHPQGKALLSLPVVDIVKIDESDPKEFEKLSNDNINVDNKRNSSICRPLSGIRVVDMTRVLAGPTATRLLAEQGSDVMHISSPNLPFVLATYLETGFGKRSAFIDLDRQNDIKQLKKLIKQADIFVENYHRSGLSKHGLSPLELAKLRPGIIYVSESAYGEAGPELGAIDSPKLFPGYLNNYLTGYLAAFGACAALIRRAK